MIHQVMFCDRCGRPADLTTMGFSYASDFLYHRVEKKMVKCVIRNVKINVHNELLESDPLHLCNNCQYLLEKWMEEGRGETNE